MAHGVSNDYSEHGLFHEARRATNLRPRPMVARTNTDCVA
jgi:hypothetical protein